MISPGFFGAGRRTVSFTAPIQLPGLTLDPQWYRRSVFYEVMVRSFVDSNADGAGDLAGLIGKLDYLQWLGIDALWIPPFFRSPLQDGGYDVSDYRQVLPEFGTLDEFKELVTKAHERNMRIVIDLPMNHTSVQHEWFQRSREDPTGPYGDFYVWSDTDEKYPNIRIIFTDTEDSNWAFDPVRRQFFFHRFFSHQPDLNFDNPAVQEAMFEIVRFWLDLGVDGFRLDAIPYLFESDEGNGEGEPPTHEFLRRLRAMVDRDYPGRIMIAEANQWPREVAAFFGTEEEPECHMAFDFPVMPRIFYSLRSQQADELVRVLSETTDIPEGAGWGVFLRNHDELTLEMVSEEYRQAMYGWYAYDPRMRANIGIRRRLAPLLDNSRAELELSITETRLGWATTSGSPTGTARVRRCSGRPIAMPDSRMPTPANCICRSCNHSCTTTRRQTLRRISPSQGHSCTGCATSFMCARVIPHSGSVRFEFSRRTTSRFSPSPGNTPDRARSMAISRNRSCASSALPTTRWPSVSKSPIWPEPGCTTSSGARCSRHSMTRAD